MARRTRPRLGLCPIGKFVFSHADAVRLKGELQELLKRREEMVPEIDKALLAQYDATSPKMP